MKLGNKTVQILYGISIVIVLFLANFLHKNVNVDVFLARNPGDYSIISLQGVIVDDKDTPIGKKREFTIPLENVPKDGASLVFYSSHQYVEVFIDDELIYSVKSADEGTFVKTPGCSWNRIPLYVDDEGKTVTVNLIPAYENVIERVPDFYVGSHFKIWNAIFFMEWTPLIMSILAIFIGIVFVLFVLFNRKNKGMDRSLFMLGCFAICIGLWKFFDTKFSVLFLQHIPVLSFIPFMALLLTIVPFVLYVKDLFNDNENKLWYISCVLNFGVVVISIGLQMTGLADLREIAWINHLVMFFVAVVVITIFIRENRGKQLNRKLVIMISCTIICLVGMMVDMVIYYIDVKSTQMVLGMVGFLIFIVSLGFVSLRETRDLIAFGLQAQNLERIAYQDQLTGLYNRTAYANHVRQMDLAEGMLFMIMLDLNNLKKCNDTFGHEKGDEYIKNSAGIIKDCFSELGKCYRIGGDEFCVLVQGHTLHDCRLHMAAMQDKIDEYNATHPDSFKMGIACGCVKYDSLTDYSLEDTMRRADKAMYHKKIEMKNEMEAK